MKVSRREEIVGRLLHDWRFSRYHEISTKLRWKSRGVCLRHMTRLHFRGEWFTWECAACRRRDGRWD